MRGFVPMRHMSYCRCLFVAAAAHSGARTVARSRECKRGRRVAAYVFHYQHPLSSPRDIAFVFKLNPSSTPPAPPFLATSVAVLHRLTVRVQVLVAGDAATAAATAAASQLSDGTCRMCRLQISRYVRLYAQDEAVFSQEDFQHLPRAFSSALVSARPHRRDPSHPLPGLCEPPVWHPRYRLVPPAGSSSPAPCLPATSHAAQAVLLTSTPLAPPSCTRNQALAPPACS